MSGSTWTDAARRAVRRPAFLAACGILAVAAIGLNAATEAMQLYFKKLPVPLAEPLATIPPRMGHWLQVSKDEPLAHDLEDTLGAVEYVFRDYVDIDALPVLDVRVRREASEQGPAIDIRYSDPAFPGETPDEKVHSIEKLLTNRSYDERKMIVAAIQNQFPTAVVNCAVTYYTGMVDTVAHIPDRCYIADGFEPKEYETPTWPAGTGGDGKTVMVPVRFINFEDQSGDRGAVSTRSVAYTFYVNGERTSDPLGVRARLEKLTEKYGYYAKIELMTLVKDRAASAAMMSDFLSVARPQIERCLPDWKSLETSGRVAVAKAAAP